MTNPTRYDREQELIRRVFSEALHAVEPREAVRRALGRRDDTLTVDGRTLTLSPDARLIVLAIGKAAPAMAQGAVDVVGDRIDRGIILTKHAHLGHGVQGFDAFEAGHPIPDADGARATREILRAVEGLRADDVVLALISGGGSALLELPREPVTLEDMQATTRLLLHAGATIHELNAVRSLLSEVKGGGLRRRIGPARCVSLLLSDVLGNDPGVIASGPTIPTTLSTERAREIVERFGLWDRLPASVQGVLEADGATASPKAGDDVCMVIADNATLVGAVERLLWEEGLSTSVSEKAYDGDASDLGRALVADAQAAPDGVDVLLGGGEATVQVAGDGIGGRNTEAALVAAIELDRTGTPWVIASLASDGQDGVSDAAGAIADPETCARARETGLDPKEYLRNNDSATFFAQAGGLVTTGPSGTNVNDVYIAIRVHDEGGA